MVRISFIMEYSTENKVKLMLLQEMLQVCSKVLQQSFSATSVIRWSFLLFRT